MNNVIKSFCLIVFSLLSLLGQQKERVIARRDFVGIECTLNRDDNEFDVIGFELTAKRRQKRLPDQKVIYLVDYIQREIAPNKWQTISSFSYAKAQASFVAPKQNSSNHKLAKAADHNALRIDGTLVVAKNSMDSSKFLVEGVHTLRFLLSPIREEESSVSMQTRTESFRLTIATQEGAKVCSLE